jgi:very-short-patch-repair endonuclease
VDFLCLEKRLVIEVDGGHHCGSEGDRRRDQALRELGFRTLRFWNHEVTHNLQGVMELIGVALDDD